MAGSKKSKQIRQKEIPEGKGPVREKNPEQYYNEKPAWSFIHSDQSKWCFSKEHIGERIWSEIIPRFQALETQTWGEILIAGKKENHSVEVSSLNKTAKDRLAENCIEAEALISLRLTGNHRLYGYMNGRVFNIIWYDDDHGDNSRCVCRSYKKHT